VDTEEEKEFGKIKQQERAAILASDMAPVVTGPKRTNKKAYNSNPVFSVLNDDNASTSGRERASPSHGPSRGRGKLAKAIIPDYHSDTDRTRSASPPGSMYGRGKKETPNMRIDTLLNEDGPASTPVPVSKGPGRGNWSRNRNSGARGFKSKFDVQDAASPSGNPAVSNVSGPHGFYLPLNGTDPSHKRTRPLTQHQLAVEQYRRRRVDVILDRGLRREYKIAKKRRRRDGPIMRAWLRCKTFSNGYDTDEEAQVQTQPQMELDMAARTRTPPPPFAGLIPVEFTNEVDDHGEEAYTRAKMLSRVLRRLDRWEGGKEAVKKKEGKREDRGVSAGGGLVWMGENGRADEDGEGDGAGSGDEGADQDDDQEMEDLEEAERREAEMESEEENGEELEADRMMVDVQ
jgi:Ino eighty subunit 1